MVSKILVPTDGSKTAQKAAVYAVDLAKQLKASIIALCVVDQRLFMDQNVPLSKALKDNKKSVEDYLRETAEGYVGEVKKLCNKRGVAAKISMRMGYPVEEILKEAEKSKANLIVMGSHGRSALSATILGSVAYGVIHNDKSVPVLIVRD
jgi:nucleotide-binding universal stress UspA family protein